jgi:hypothetical protein
MAKKKKRNNLMPNSTVESQAVARFEINRKQMDPRQFRDAVTKASGSVRGIPTNAEQWNRWSP